MPVPVDAGGLFTGVVDALLYAATGRGARAVSPRGLPFRNKMAW